MLELLELKIENFLKTYRRMARLIYKDINTEDENDKKLKELFDSLGVDIEQGSIEGIEKDLPLAITLLKEAFKFDLKIEELGVLFSDEITSEVKKEESSFESVQKDIVKLHINKTLLEEDNTNFNEETKKAISKYNIKTRSDLREKLVSRFTEVLNQIKKLHSEMIAHPKSLIIQLQDQHTNRERLRNEVFSNFAHYDAKQASRYLKWNTKDGQRIIGKVGKEENQLIRLVHRIESADDIKELFEGFDNLKKDLDDQESELSKMLKSISVIFTLAISRFFRYKHLEQKEIEVVSTLKAEGYEETRVNEFMSKIKSIDEMVEKETLSVSRAARIQYQDAA